MKNRLLIAITILLALAGCSNERSVTGTSDHVLMGELVAAGTLAASQHSILSLGAGPVVGVEVRAVGTGVFSVSDNSGRFSLVGLPPTVDLTFKRSDGINASAKVNVKNLPVVTVELSMTTANVTASGQAKREIEGLILAVSATSITVDDASTHGPVTVAITPATAIRHGKTTVLATDLKQGDRVHVRALINGDGTLSALEIMLQNPAEGGDDNPAVQQLEGPIVRISATEITVTDASRHADVTAKITAQTSIRKGNTTLLWSDLKPGDRVHVKATGTGTDLTAEEIKLQNPG